MKNLVIVESPTKSRTLSRFLGDSYQVIASMGHIRDLPKSEIGVDVEHGFEPKYIIPKAKTKMVNELKKTASEAETLWLATDPDREGEAIAWHINELLSNSKIKNEENQKKGVKRVVFHEITPEAVKESFEHPRDLDMQLVDAQQGRRILDRLVGYKLSPLLWKKVKSGLSAGRVQSVAVRLIVEREEEVKAFKPIEYWTIEAELETGSKGEKNRDKFIASLVEWNGKKLEIESHSPDTFSLGKKEDVDIHLQKLEKAGYKIDKITKKEINRYPSPPFTTSTLQQTAAGRLGMTAKKTMMHAQALYERGLITYMRTDSVNLAQPALLQIRKIITEKYGKDYIPEQPKFYKTKSKLAQEAHEAIRPTNPNLDPEKLKTHEGLGRDDIRLYELIWKRAMACQMKEATLDQTTVDVNAKSSLDTYLFRVVGSVIKFEGWLKVYGIGKSDKGNPSTELRVKVKREEEEEKEDEEKILPELTEGASLNLLNLLSLQHFTEPPPRFNEASLIKKMEELGIGRPSTYAPTISTIQDRYYVEKIDRRFIPTELGNVVTKFLKEYFPNIVDYDFTATMEDHLDEIAQGMRSWQQTIGDFYHPFEEKLEQTEKVAEKVEIEVEKVDKKCPTCAKDLVVRFGRFGKFLACSGFPDCKYTEALTEKIDIPCPKCGGEIVSKRTKRGKIFYGCKNWPKCDFASWTKPGEKGTAKGITRRKGTIRQSNP